MKTYERIFQTAIDLSTYNVVAQEIIDKIEKDTINVFRPDDEHALDDIQDAEGAFLLDAKATMPVSIREWLPVVCQFLRWEGDTDLAAPVSDAHKGSAAYYRSNAYEVLWPVEGFEPAGPGALIAGIVLRDEKIFPDNNRCPTTKEDCLRFVLAHELVHAFHAMRFVVPAFMNWPKFWEEVLCGGAHCSALANNHNYRGSFLDNYGTELELGEVLEFWPSHGKQWFEAWHKPKQSP